MRTRHTHNVTHNGTPCSLVAAAPNVEDASTLTLPRHPPSASCCSSRWGLLAREAPLPLRPLLLPILDNGGRNKTEEAAAARHDSRLSPTGAPHTGFGVQLVRAGFWFSKDGSREVDSSSRVEKSRSLRVSCPVIPHCFLSLSRVASLTFDKHAKAEVGTS